MMKRPLWITCAGLALAGLFASLAFAPELWARHWENQWKTFRTDWEAKGEDFGLKAHLPSKLPATTNMAAHPWLVRIAEQDSAAISRLKAMDPALIPGLDDWKYRSDDDETLLDQLHRDTELAEKLRHHLIEYDPELEAFAEAVARPELVIERDFSSGIKGIKSPYLDWSKAVEATHCRAVLAMARRDSDALASDIETLIRLGNHLRHERFAMGLVVGAGADAVACTLIQDALAEQGLLRQAERDRLRNALQLPRPAVGEAIARMLRCERGIWLKELDRLGANPGDEIELPGHPAPQAAVLRVFIARNRLAFCEEMQVHLLAPGGHPLKAIRLADLPIYDAAVTQRFDSEDPLEALAAMGLVSLGGVSRGLLRQDEERELLIEQLSRQPVPPTPATGSGDEP